MVGPTSDVEYSNLIGQTLSGRYRVESKLGAGGMATVYAAMDQTLGRQVVIKIPHAELLRQPGFRERFIEEVRSLIALVHPHILPIQDYGEFEGVPYAVVTYFSGGDLRARIDEAGGVLQIEELNKWIPQIASALDYMHSQGIVHRDIQPDNILFDEQGNLLLSDFGIAAVIHQTDSGETQINQLTQVGSFVGTTAYAPPEAIRRELSGAYDQYSLGVTIYYALSGHMPFEASTPEETFVLKSSQEPKPIVDVASHLPAEVAAVIMKSIAKQPQDRYASCTEFAKALTRAAGPVHSKTNYTAAIAAVLVTGAIAAGLFFSLLKPDPQPPSVPVVVEPPGTLFEAGSTPEEISAAMSLCEKYAPECDARDFESEILREVRIVDIEADRTEVTNADFLEFVEATDYLTEAEVAGQSYHDGFVPMRGWSWLNVDGTKARSELSHPVVHVTQKDAAAYCEWAGKRLPSEVEWEFIARGVERRIFPWGDEWDPERARWKDGSDLELQSVEAMPAGATPDGLQNLAGNVWEWTSSRTNAGKSVLKGGAWNTDNPSYLRSAMRLDEKPDFSSDDT
ncbi:MAG: SUMF1/EgtB/PvdO family nonheme iron enzyme, partial [Deltaproteobacteria bacterium]|nr:SUMF1/EgtB/PvdO family nonheme iron enzyme [Deltaproteobacteria bacterium]